MEVEATDVGRLLPEVGVVAGHPRLHLPGLQVEGFADPPGLRGRDGHTVVGHGLGQGVHGPTGSTVRRVLGDQLYQQEHVVMVVDDRASRPLLVFQTGQSELLVAGAPHPDLVVVEVAQLADGPVGLTVGGEQDDPRPFCRPGLDGVRPEPGLELGPVTSSELQWRKSHASMESHQCYYREYLLEVQPQAVLRWHYISQ